MNSPAYQAKTNGANIEVWEDSALRYTFVGFAAKAFARNVVDTLYSQGLKAAKRKNDQLTKYYAEV